MGIVERWNAWRGRRALAAQRRDERRWGKALASAMSRGDLSMVVRLVRAEEHRRLNPWRGRIDETWNGIEARRIGVRLRWEPPDRERILEYCESGDLYALGLFLDAMRANGTVWGIMNTRGTLLSLPIQYGGDPWLSETLRGREPVYDARTMALTDPGHPSDFQRLFPLSELAQVLWDGDLGGVGVGEFLPDVHQGLPRLRHLDVHHVRYDWGLKDYTYTSGRDTYVIKPGAQIPGSAGRWFLYLPYGRERPWARAPWLPCALPVINAHESVLDRLRWQKDHSDPLKLALLDKDRDETEILETSDWMRSDWHRSPWRVQRVGEDMQIVEGTGRGYEVYDRGESSGDRQIQRTLAGQESTSGDAPGWSKGNIHKDIADSIKGDSAARMAEAVQEQGLVWYAAIKGREPNIWIAWDLRSPERKLADTKAIGEICDSVEKADRILSARGARVRLPDLLEDVALTLPIEDLPEDTSASNVRLDIAPTDLVTVLTADEVRQNRGLKPWGGARGSMSLAALKAEAEAPGDAGAAPLPIPRSPPALPAKASAEHGEVRHTAGLTIVVDRPAGTVQRGIGPDGPWERTFAVDNGGIVGTRAPDGEEVDVYMGPEWSNVHPDATVYVVDQIKHDGSPDEPKVLIGFASLDDAVATYLEHVPSWAFGGVRELPAYDLLLWVEQYAR